MSIIGDFKKSYLRSIYSIGIVYFTIVCAAIQLVGCSVDGVKHLTVVDKNQNQINGILVIPLYSRSFVIGFGVDGKGLETKNHLIVTAPFEFDSGDDLMRKKIPTRGVGLQPIFFVGMSNYLDNWLLIKKGYSPKLIKRSDVYKDEPIMMTSSPNNENVRLIDMLLAVNPDQPELKKQFNIKKSDEEIIVELDEKSIWLLKQYR